MSITETPQTPPAPRKHKRPNKRKARAAAPAPKPASELAGITVDKCPSGCDAEHCVISGRSVCAHPHKGGLQGADMHNPEALGRLGAAKRVLGKRMVDARLS